MARSSSGRARILTATSNTNRGPAPGAGCQAGGVIGERDPRFGLWPDGLQQRIVIIDTCRLLDDLKARVKGEPQLGGSSIADVAVGTLYFASSHVFTELHQADRLGFPDKFHKLAHQALTEGWPTEVGVFRDAFEQHYRPRLRFIDIEDLYRDHDLARSITHLNDVPTGQVAALLAPLHPVVFSPDRDLWEPGVAPRDLPAVLQATSTLESRDGATLGASAISIAAGVGVHAAVKKASDRARVSPGLTYAVVGLVALLLLRSEARRAKLREAAGVAGTRVGEFWNMAEAAASILEDAGVAHSAETDVIQAVACALAVSSRPMSVAALVESGLGQSEVSIQAALEANPCFTLVDGFGWILGTLDPSV